MFGSHTTARGYSVAGGTLLIAMPDGAKVRLTFQWTEAHDASVSDYPGPDLYRTPLADLHLLVLRQHVEFSELILRGVPGLQDILEPVMHHHERWDGSGYPRGLAGEAVPLLGRIMIVADAYSAISGKVSARSSISWWPRNSVFRWSAYR